MSWRDIKEKTLINRKGEGLPIRNFIRLPNIERSKRMIANTPEVFKNFTEAPNLLKCVGIASALEDINKRDKK